LNYKIRILCFIALVMLISSNILYSEDDNYAKNDKDIVEVDSQIIKDEIPYYKTSLKQLLQDAEKNIKKIDKDIADQQFLDTYKEKADTIREYIAKANNLKKEGNLQEAKRYYKMALEISKEPEMKKYMKLKNWKGSWLKWQ